MRRRIMADFTTVGTAAQRRRLEQAFNFVIRCYDGKVLKDGFTPMAIHSADVMRLAQLHLSRPIRPKTRGGYAQYRAAREEYAARLEAALGHDLLEDTAATPEQLRRHFTPRAVQLIAQLTLKDKNEKTVSLEEYGRRLLAMHRRGDAGAVFLKAMDRIAHLHMLKKMRARPELVAHIRFKTQKHLQLLWAGRHNEAFRLLLHEARRANFEVGEDFTSFVLRAPPPRPIGIARADARPPHVFPPADRHAY